MNHVTDQDLLLLAHRSLGFFRSLGVAIHLRTCSSCRKRYTEMATMSTAIASSLRVGMRSAWKPAGMALRMKILLSALVMAGGVLAVRQATMPNDSFVFPSFVSGDACSTAVQPKSLHMAPAMLNENRSTPPM